MSDEARLISVLDRIDGRSYPAYKALLGEWDLGGFTIGFDRVQGDPFAAPSRIRVSVQSTLESGLYDTKERRIAAEDWLLRRFVAGLRPRRLGSGRSGEMRCLQPGPEVEERSAVRLHDDGRVEVRFQIGLPARGRRVLGQAAWSLLDEDVRDAALALREHRGADLHVESVCRQRALRRAMCEEGLVAFISDGAVLPRASGVTQEPLDGAVVFHSPESLAVRLVVDGEMVRGMGIPRGVTAIVGGGFHGKSTLLQAIQRGHLDHVPGDGREGVVAHPYTAKIRAEDGRRVAQVDISSFLRDLPGGRSTAPFTTEDASGSTSQAAAVVEALEAGAQVLLIDEDTSASNLLARDELMRTLIPQDREPITPMVEHVRPLMRASGVSTIIVVGGVGDYLRVADTVIGMNAYRAEDLRPSVSELVGPVSDLSDDSWSVPMTRTVSPASLASGKIKVGDDRRIRYGDSDIDVVGVEQILSRDHAWSVARALAVIHERADGPDEVSVLLDRLEALLDTEGIDGLAGGRTADGGLIRPRRLEVAAAMNRYRRLKVDSRS